MEPGAATGAYRVAPADLGRDRAAIIELCSSVIEGFTAGRYEKYYERNPHGPALARQRELLRLGDVARAREAGYTRVCTSVYAALRAKQDAFAIPRCFVYERWHGDELAWQVSLYFRLGAAA